MFDSLIKGEKPNELNYSIESIICRSSELRQTKKRVEIKEELRSEGLRLTDTNDFLMVCKSVSIATHELDLLPIINRVVVKADELEEKYTGGDLEL